MMTTFILDWFMKAIKSMNGVGSSAASGPVLHNIKRNWREKAIG